MRGFLEKSLRKDQVLGVDPRLVTLAGLDRLRASIKKAGAKLKLVDRNLIDVIWQDQPDFPMGAVTRQSVRYAGKSTAKKLESIRGLLKKERAHALVVTRLDSLAWLYNLRGGDVEFNPVAVAYGLITAKSATLYIHSEKVPPPVERSLGSDVELRSYDEVVVDLRDLAKKKRTVWVDPGAANAWIARALKGASLLRRPSPIPAIKARKNRVEIRGAKEAHLRDAVALVRFLRWLEQRVGKERLTELSAAERLESLRAESDLYRGPSFRTISAMGSNGAIVHYAPTPASDRQLTRGGIYLVDSGGQYLDGTTDVTRTVLLGGRAKAEQRDQFTRVLKGMVSLTLARFPAGTSGMQLDAFARRSLWDVGLDYGHGTGHGVGSYLGVHESPPGIAPKRLPEVALEEGHILSNEPGYYRKGKYGFRTENLVLVVRDRELSKPKEPFLGFETLTLCPIDRRLVVASLLDERERRWVDAYHEDIVERLEPLLEAADAAWLRRATAPL